MKINIPSDAKKILTTLHQNGYKAYLVGGCVRDSLLNKEPKDWDITTNAKPTDVMSLFDKTIPTGLQHGTVTVMIDGEGYEVTTFRVESEYSDKRHPSNVTFVDNIADDLSRRDLTINAMAFNETEGLIDPFGGQSDLENKVIKCVGSPNARFKEDALRMMRAIRFASQLEFKIEECTFQAIRNNSSELKRISIERIRDEFNKILLSNNPLMYVKMLISTKLSSHFLPELEGMIKFDQNNTYHHLDLFEHILTSVANVDSQLHLRLAMLLHDVGKLTTKTTDEQGMSHYYGHPKESVNMATDILKRMKYSNEIIITVLLLIEFHDVPFDGKKTIKRMLGAFGKNMVEDIIKVKSADIMAQNPQYLVKRQESLKTSKELINEIIAQEECFSLRDLKVNGRDLMAIGFKAGKELGEMLNYLLEMVMENKELNDREILINIAKRKYQ